MVVLVFDTETNGLPLEREKGKLPPPSDHPDQPHLTELALGLFEPDGTEIGIWSRLVQLPSGVTIPPDIQEKTGITVERTMAEGVPLLEAVDKFIQAIEGRCTIVVAHNPFFDVKIMRIAMLRAGKDREFCDQIKKLKPTFDTCRAATPIVNLPPTVKMLAAGFKRPKPPKLEECHQHFFGSPLEGAHQAARDVRFTAWLYFELERLKAAKETEAKESV